MNGIMLWERGILGLGYGSKECPPKWNGGAGGPEGELKSWAGGLRVGRVESGWVSANQDA